MLRLTPTLLLLCVLGIACTSTFGERAGLLRRAQDPADPLASDVQRHRLLGRCDRRPIPKGCPGYRGGDSSADEDNGGGGGDDKASGNEENNEPSKSAKKKKKKKKSESDSESKSESEDNSPNGGLLDKRRAKKEKLRAKKEAEMRRRQKKLKQKQLLKDVKELGAWPDWVPKLEAKQEEMDIAESVLSRKGVKAIGYDKDAFRKYVQDAEPRLDRMYAALEKDLKDQYAIGNPQFKLKRDPSPQLKSDLRGMMNDPNNAANVARKRKKALKEAKDLGMDNDSSLAQKIRKREKVLDRMRSELRKAKYGSKEEDDLKHEIKLLEADQKQDTDALDQKSQVEVERRKRIRGNLKNEVANFDMKEMNEARRRRKNAEKLKQELAGMKDKIAPRVKDVVAGVDVAGVLKQKLNNVMQGKLVGYSPGKNDDSVRLETTAFYRRKAKAEQDQLNAEIAEFEEKQKELGNDAFELPSDLDQRKNALTTKLDDINMVDHMIKQKQKALDAGDKAVADKYEEAIAKTLEDLNPNAKKENPLAEGQVINNINDTPGA